jgi:hypothetical protein
MLNKVYRAGTAGANSFSCCSTKQILLPFDSICDCAAAAGQLPDSCRLRQQATGIIIISLLLPSVTLLLQEQLLQLLLQWLLPLLTCR